MKINILDVINEIRNTSDCIVYNPCGLPDLDKENMMPEDLMTFYKNCGGTSLFVNEEYGFTVVKPEEMKLANPVIIGELCEDDISSEWYIICKDNEDNYITIDLSRERLGWCYDSFWDRHGVVGECSIIAKSFTELLKALLDSRGKYLYWLENDFKYIGDAYDEL